MTSLTGTGKLLRLALRRDRVRLPVWVIALAALLTALAASNIETYDTDAARTAAASALAANPALRVLRGPAADASIGAFIVSDAFWLLSVLAALMSALTVIRHSRHDEETGRAELIGAGPVGAHAGLAAALAIAVAANVSLFFLLAAGLLVNNLPVAGSLAASASVAAVGICFGGLAAIAAQLPQHARTSTAIATAAIATAYLLRAAGDAAGEIDPSGVTAATTWPTWLSPIGWSQQVHPFAGNRWWLLALPAALFAACVAIAFRLRTRRDFGQGLLPARGGPADAPSTFASAFALATRLHRNTLAAWMIGIAVAAALLGSLGREVDVLDSESDLVAILSRLGSSATTLADTYFAAIMALIGALCAIYPIQVLLRMRAEETEGRLEAVLATAVDRRRWIAGHVGWAFAGTVVILAVAGMAAAAADAVVSDSNRAGALMAAGLVQAPAILALAAFIAAAYAMVPRAADTIAWIGVATSLTLGPLGDIFDIPGPVRDISPLSHTPALPAAEFTAAPVLVMLAAAGLLSAVSLVALNRRNLALPA